MGEMDRDQVMKAIYDWRREQHNSMGGMGEPALEVPADKLLRFDGYRFVIRVDDLVEIIEGALPPKSRRAPPA